MAPKVAPATRSLSSQEKEIQMAEKTIRYCDIKAGSRVTIMMYSGMGRDGPEYTIRKTGRAVILGPAGWVLNMGGRYGTPAIATPENVVAVGGKQ